MMYCERCQIDPSLRGSCGRKACRDEYHLQEEYRLAHAPKLQETKSGGLPAGRTVSVAAKENWAKRKTWTVRTEAHRVADDLYPIKTLADWVSDRIWIPGVRPDGTTASVDIRLREPATPAQSAVYEHELACATAKATGGVAPLKWWFKPFVCRHCKDQPHHASCLCTCHQGENLR